MPHNVSRDADQLPHSFEIARGCSSGKPSHSPQVSSEGERENVRRAGSRRWGVGANTLGKRSLSEKCWPALRNGGFQLPLCSAEHFLMCSRIESAAVASMSCPKTKGEIADVRSRGFASLSFFHSPFAWEGESNTCPFWAGHAKQQIIACS